MNKNENTVLKQHLDLSKYTPKLSKQDYKRARRYTAFFKILHRYIKLDNISVVEDRKTMEQVQSLLYQEYRRMNLCKENKRKKFFSPYQYSSSGTTLVSKKKGKLIGTIAVLEDSVMKLPSDSLYTKELEQIRNKGKRLVEVSELALDHKKFKRSYSLKSFKKMNSLFSLFNGMVNYVYQFTDATDLVIMVNPKHASLYTFIGFNLYAEPKFYEKVGKIAVPMILDIEKFLSTADKSLPAYNVISNFRKFPDSVPFYFSSTDLAERLITSLGWKSITDREFVGLLDVDPKL